MDKKTAKLAIEFIMAKNRVNLTADEIPLLMKILKALHEIAECPPDPES